MAHLESLVILDAAGRSGAALAFGFERAQYRVYATRDPGDALGMALTRASQLVVVGVEEEDDGELDALSFIGRLREEPPTRELAVVAVGERSRREAALRAGADEFVTRPAFIRDVLTLARLAVALRQDSSDAGAVSGLLEEYGLYFLVRALAVAGRSGVLELDRAGRTGEVLLANGAVVAAKVGGMSGVAAFQHLLLWGEAQLSVRFESPAGQRRISVGVEDLLDEGALFARRFESYAERVGGALAIYVHKPRRSAELGDKIPEDILGVCKLFDGRAPLIDVVEDSPYKPFDTLQIAHRLAELGAIERQTTPKTPLLTERLAVRDWLLAGKDADHPRAPAVEDGVTAAVKSALEASAATTPAPAKLSPGALATAPPKEPVFDQLEEEFFAREEQHRATPPVDRFDDLEPPPSGPRKLSGRRDWFGFKKR